ncbi:MAG: DUF5719 family protein [Microbacterium sp.]
MSGRSTPARLALGIVVACAAAAVAVGAVVVPLPHSTTAAVSITAQPAASDAVVACTGPVLASGRDATDASELTDAAAQRLIAGVSAGAPDATEETLLAPDVTSGAGPVAYTAASSDAAVTDVAAAGSSRLSADDVTGFAASACGRAQLETWLTAGSATTGAADLVVLANPGEVAAQVTITVYGAQGASVPAAGTDIVVDAGTQRVIPMAALALGEENPVLQVTASEAPVRASVQASLTRVLDPGGVDQIGPSAVPAARIVIPGVPVTSAPGETGDSDVPTSLRLLAPSADATATVTVYRDATAVGEPQSVPLLAGVPLQLDLAGLDPGSYTVVVEATAPVTGAVWATSGFDAGSDFGWFVAAERLTVASLVAVAAGDDPVLTLFGDGVAQTVTVRADAGAGTATAVEVPADGAAEVSVTAGEVYLIEPDAGADAAGASDAGLYAAVTYAQTGAIAGYAVAPAAAAADAFTVYPR